MPQNPYFSRKLIGFDGGGLVLAFATLRCTSKPPQRQRCGGLLCSVKVSRNPTEFGLSLAQPCALRAVALTVHQQIPRRLRCGLLLCIVKVNRNPTEFGLTLAQPCALRAVALTVHQPDTRPLP